MQLTAFFTNSSYALFGWIQVYKQLVIDKYELLSGTLKGTFLNHAKVYVDIARRLATTLSVQDLNTAIQNIVMLDD